jgi:cysteine desulfuration protein SufE
MSDMPKVLQDAIEDIEMAGDSDRPLYLIDYSDRFESVPPEIASKPYPEFNHVKDCESDAYVFPEERPDGTLTFHFAVNNPQGVSARAFSKILKDAIDGQPADVINAIPEDIVTRLFGKGISMGKGIGLRGILNMVKYFANEHAKNQN